MNGNLILYASTFIVGGMFLYAFVIGKAIVQGTPEIIRRGNPFRYWVWVLFQAAVFSV